MVDLESVPLVERVRALEAAVGALSVSGEAPPKCDCGSCDHVWPLEELLHIMETTVSNPQWATAIREHLRHCLLVADYDYPPRPSLSDQPFELPQRPGTAPQPEKESRCDLGWDQPCWCNSGSACPRHPANPPVAAPPKEPPAPTITYKDVNVAPAQEPLKGPSNEGKGLSGSNLSSSDKLPKVDIGERWVLKTDAEEKIAALRAERDEARRLLDAAVFGVDHYEKSFLEARKQVDACHDVNDRMAKTPWACGTGADFNAGGEAAQRYWHDEFSKALRGGGKDTEGV